MISTLLIANRGEIARRIMRTCREMGIRTVAVYSTADAGAPFVREADVAVELPGTASLDTYLSIERLLAAAARTGADAVHPGYGFLAERTEFARAVVAEGLVFVGPPASVMAAMGDKLAAKSAMAAAGLPILADVTDFTDLAAADGLGWPLLVKATAGGGGKGMRLVPDRDHLADAIRSAQREALASFGDAGVYLERYLGKGRHVEVQIFGDSSGRVIQLGERDCSLQRRHQKIIEESPSPALDASTRAALWAAAVAAGEAAAYQNAGTVEFLLAPSGEFFFLELNARLQVEHPVTEVITGLDLVRLQLEVASGLPLPSQGSIPLPNGWAIEARIYAEDPLAGLRPTGGHLHRFSFPAGVRVDAGVEAGSEVGSHYDPLLAKVIAAAPTRAAAAYLLAAALEQAEIHGVTTNRELLSGILRHPEFLSGEADLSFFEHHPIAELGTPRLSAEGAKLHALVASLCDMERRRAERFVHTSIPSGWRNLASQPQRRKFREGETEIEVWYRIAGSVVEFQASPLSGTARVFGLSPIEADLEWDGVRRLFRAENYGNDWWIDSALGSSALTLLPRFPTLQPVVAAGSLRAPTPGVIVSLPVAAGETVSTGAVIAVLEAMKIEQRIVAPAGGRLTQLRVRVGEQVEAGTELAVIEAEGA